MRSHLIRREAPAVLTETEPHGHVSVRHFATCDMSDSIIGKSVQAPGPADPPPVAQRGAHKMRGRTDRRRPQRQRTVICNCLREID